MARLGNLSSAVAPLALLQEEFDKLRVELEQEIEK
jgi:hypothetical protein